MGPVDVVEDHLPEVGQVPPLADGSVRVRAFEPPDDGTGGLALAADHLEGPAHQRHLLVVDDIAVPLFVVAEAVVGGRTGDDLPAPGILELLREGPLGYLGVLVFGEVVLYGAHQAFLGGVLVLVFQGPQGAALLAELFLEDEDVAALAGYPVPLRRKDEVHTALGHPPSYPIYTGPPEGVALVAVVHGLHHDLVGLLPGVLAELPELSRQRVALLRLFVGGYPGVEDGLFGTAPVGARHPTRPA